MATHVADKSRTDGKGDNECAAPQIIVLRGPHRRRSKAPVPVSHAGAHLATEIGFAAEDIRAAVIKDSGRWIMEEQPEQAISVILSFLKSE